MSGDAQKEVVGSGVHVSHKYHINSLQWGRYMIWFYRVMSNAVFENTFLLRAKIFHKISSLRFLMKRSQRHEQRVILDFPHYILLKGQEFMQACSEDGGGGCMLYEIEFSLFVP